MSQESGSTLKAARAAAFIARLTGAEKRYFRTQAAQEAAVPLYMEIFEYLEGHPDTTEAAFHAHFRGRDFLRNPASAIHYLMQQLRSSLAAYYCSRFPSFSLAEELQGAKVLLLRGFISEAQKLLRSIRKRAAEVDDPFLLPQALYWERKALLRSRKATVPLDEVIQNGRESRRMLRKLVQAAEWEMKFYQMAQFIYGKGHARKPSALKKYEEWIEKHGQDLEDNFEAAYYRLNMLGRLYREQDDWVRSHASRQQLVSLIERRAEWMRMFSDHYSVALSNLTHSSSALGDTETLHTVLEKMKTLTVTDPDQQRLLRLSAFMAELNLYQEQGRFSLCPPVMTQAVPLYEQSRNLLVKANEILYLYYFAYTAYGVRNYRESLRWIHRLLEDTQASNYVDVHCMAHVLRLVIYYETSNHSSAARVARKSLDFVQRNGDNKKPEILLIQFILQWAHGPHPENPPVAALRKLESAVQKISQNPTQRHAYDLFHLEAWTRAQHNGSTYEAALQEVLERGG